MIVLFKKRDNSTTVKVLEKCVPSVIINPDALTKMYIYTDECDDEIAWLGTAYRDTENNIIYINDVFLFDQEIASTTVDVSSEDLSTFGEKLLQQKDGIEIWNNLKVWGHSHVNMGTSPSKTDEEQMETFSEGGHDWFIRIITNKKDDLRVDLFYYDQGIIYNDIPWQAHLTKKEKEIEEKINKLYKELEEFQEQRFNKFTNDIEQEIQLKVKKKSQTTYNNAYYNNWFNHQGYQHQQQHFPQQQEKKNQQQQTQQQKLEKTMIT